MASKGPAAAATLGSASDREVGAARHSQRRRASPSPIRSRPRSQSPLPNLRPSATVLSSTPTYASANFAAAPEYNNDAASGGRAPSLRPTSREQAPRDYLDSDADIDAGTGGPVPSPRHRAERSPSLHSHSDAIASGRVPSPKHNREGTPRRHSDFNTTAAAAASEDDGASAGDASPLPRMRPSSRIKTSQRRHIPRERHSPEYQKRPARVWSPEDEVTILNALIEYRAKKGRLPGSIHDTSKLHRQIIGRLTANASTKTQLSDKIRRLKHKYKLLVTRAKNRRDPDFPTEHERVVYELSKQVWEFRKALKGGSRPYEDTGDAESHEEQDTKDSDDDMENGWKHCEHTSKNPKTFRFENGNGNAIATEGRASHDNASARDDAEKEKQMYPYLWEAVEELCEEHPSGSVFRKAFGVLEKSKAIVMEEKLRKFKMSVIRQQLRRTDLIKESVGRVLEALEGAY